MSEKLPEGWETCDLTQITTLERGRFSPRPRNNPIYYGGNIPFVQTGDITKSGTYLKEFTQTLNEKGVRVSKVFPTNTILITIAANIGETAITTFPTACPDSVVAISVHKAKAHVFWLKMYLDMEKENIIREALI